MIDDILGTRDKARRNAPQRHKSLRFESLEQRELLTAATAGDFATLKQLAEEGRDYEIELTADISLAAGETIAIGAGNISIDGGSGGHTITVNSGVTRTASLFTVSGGSLTLGNLTIDGLVKSSGSGGVITQSGGTITVNSGTTISNCAAKEKGGVAHITGGNIIVGLDASDDTEVMFTDNETTTSDGGVFYINGKDSGKNCKLTVYHGTFDGNVSGSAGGIAYLYTKSTTEIKSGTFTNNSAVKGGVFRIGDSGKITISDGTFSGNTATSTPGGGVLYVSKATVTINGGTFTGNMAASSDKNFGGGVITTDDSNAKVTITGGAFSGNKTEGTNSKGGGVIFIKKQGKVTIEGGTFSENLSGTAANDHTTLRHNGSVVSIEEGSGSLTITGGTFSGNQSTRGAVIYANNSNATVIISGGTFTSNLATDEVYGGGVIDNLGKLTINDGTFTSNVGSLGGAIHNRGTATINGGTFESNVAVRGGRRDLHDENSHYQRRCHLP